MKNNGNRVTINGKDFTGWRADVIVYAIVTLLLGIGFASGWSAGVNSTHSEVARD